MMLAGSTVLALMLLTAPVLAQGEDQSEPLIKDVPLGFPYRTGSASQAQAQAQVPLRDYLSSRMDMHRTETIDRLENLERQLLRLIDERDRQYAQRFDAQQKALGDALQASKESGAKELQATKEQSANALAASEKAIIKAEDAANKRFEGVNEFRSTLSDQAAKFITNDTATARFEGLDTRFKALEDKVADVIARLNDLTSQDMGASTLWGYILGAIGLALALGAFAMNINRVNKARL